MRVRRDRPRPPPPTFVGRQPARQNRPAARARSSRRSTSRSTRPVPPRLTRSCASSSTVALRRDRGGLFPRRGVADRDGLDHADRERRDRPPAASSPWNCTAPRARSRARSRARPRPDRRTRRPALTNGGSAATIALACVELDEARAARPEDEPDRRRAELRRQQRVLDGRDAADLDAHHARTPRKRRAAPRPDPAARSAARRPETRGSRRASSRCRSAGVAQTALRHGDGALRASAAPVDRARRGSTASVRRLRLLTPMSVGAGVGGDRAARRRRAPPPARATPAAAASASSACSVAGVERADDQQDRVGARRPPPRGSGSARR